MRKKLNKAIAIALCLTFFLQQASFAQGIAELNLAGHIAGTGRLLSVDKFRPLHLRYLDYNQLNNNFNLLLDKGDQKGLKDSGLKEGTRKLMEYFFTGVTLPNDSFWVNLRPDSPDNVIDGYLSQTDFGKVLLEADLQLKKDTARLTSPAQAQGKLYWDKLYKKAAELLGNENTNIPTLVRPWIVPGDIIIRESKDSAYIYKATLKVVLEEDCLKDSVAYNFKDPRLKALNEYSSRLLKELILPILNKEVNSAKKYSSLRQAYYSLILAQWFKARFYGKGGTYSSLIDQKNLNGLISQTNWSKQDYFKAYQESFKNGEYNLKQSQQVMGASAVRSYFSGGALLADAFTKATVINAAVKGAGSPVVGSAPLASFSVKGGTFGDPAGVSIEEGQGAEVSAASPLTRQTVFQKLSLSERLKTIDTAIDSGRYYEMTVKLTESRRPEKGLYKIRSKSNTADGWRVAIYKHNQKSADEYFHSVPLDNITNIGKEFFVGLSSSGRGNAGSPLSMVRTLPYLAGYDWGGKNKGLQKLLKSDDLIAEMWGFYTGETPEADKIYLSDGKTTFKEWLKQNPEALGAGLSEKPFFVKFLSTDFNPVMYIGFNPEKVEKAGLANGFFSAKTGLNMKGFKEWYLGRLLTELSIVEKLTVFYNKNSVSDKPGLLEAYKRWALEQDNKGWARGGRDVTVLDKFFAANHSELHGILNDFADVHADVVSVMHRLDCAEDKVLWVESTTAHGLQGLSLQYHPVGRSSKSEMWGYSRLYDENGNDIGWTIVEPQQTSNTTYSYSDPFTPITLKNGTFELRKKGKMTPEVLEEAVNKIMDMEPRAEGEYFKETTVKSGTDSNVAARIFVDDLVRWPYFSGEKINLNGSEARAANYTMAAKGSFMEVWAPRGKATVSWVNVGGGKESIEVSAAKPAFLSAEIKSDIRFSAGETTELYVFWYSVFHDKAVGLAGIASSAIEKTLLERVGNNETLNKLQEAAIKSGVSPERINDALTRAVELWEKGVSPEEIIRRFQAISKNQKKLSQDGFVIWPTENNLIVQPTWGGDLILKAKKLTDSPWAGKKIGQSYELNGDTEIDLDGIKVMASDAAAILGDKFLGRIASRQYNNRMRMLIKLTDAKGNSFQVHLSSDRENHPSGYQQKPESWHWLSDGLMTYGLKIPNGKSGVGVKTDYERVLKALDEKMQELSRRMMDKEEKLSQDKAEAQAAAFTKEMNPYKFVNIIVAKKGMVTDLSKGGIHHSWDTLKELKNLMPEQDFNDFAERLKAAGVDSDPDKSGLNNYVYEVQVDVPDDASSVRGWDKSKFRDAAGNLRRLNVDDGVYLDMVDVDPGLNDSSRALVNPMEIQDKDGVRILQHVVHPMYAMQTIILQPNVSLNDDVYTNTVDSFHHYFVSEGDGVRVVFLDKPTQEPLFVKSGYSFFLPGGVGNYRLEAVGKKPVSLEKSFVKDLKTTENPLSISASRMNASGNEGGQSNGVGFSSSSPLNDKMGGIDLRKLPAVTHYADAILSTWGSLSSSEIDECIQDIQRMLRANIHPSTERLVEMAASCSKQGSGEEIEQVMACVADVLRLEEEQAQDSDLKVRQLMAMLEPRR